MISPSALRSKDSAPSPYPLPRLGGEGKVRGCRLNAYRHYVRLSGILARGNSLIEPTEWPMPKERSVVKDYAVYLVVRCVICAIQALPYKAACELGALLAWLAERVDKRHR